MGIQNVLRPLTIFTPDTKVTKFECIGHVQKRMGTLRIFFLENYYKDWLDNKFSQSQSIQKYLQQPLK